MSERAMIERAVAELRARGVRRSAAAPPVFRWLWRAGLYVPPPHFVPLWPLVLVLSVLYGVPFAALMLPVFLWGVLEVNTALSQSGALLVGLGGAVAAGMLFGSIVGPLHAVSVRWSASRLSMPSWSEFREEHEAAA